MISTSDKTGKPHRLRRLFLSTVSDDFNPQIDIALGEWCFAGKEEIWPEWHQQEFYTPFNNFLDRGKQADATRWLAHQLISDLASELNVRHGTEYSIEFWHRQLINWTLHLVQGSWKLYKLLEHTVEIYGDKTLEIQIIGPSHITSIDSSFQFIINLFENRLFTWSILSEITKELAPLNWNLIEVKKIDKLESVQLSFDKLRPHFHNVSGVRRRVDAPFVALMSLLCWIKRPVQKTHFIQPVIIPANPFPAKFLQVIKRLMELTIPKTFTDNFIDLDAKIKSRPRRPGSIRLGGVQLNSDSDAFESAHSLLAGEKVISVQHGGAYGWNDRFDQIAEVEYSLSAFITWGWSQHSDYRGTFLPLPCPMLSRKKYKRKNSNLLFVGTVMYAFNPRLDQYPPPINYRTDKLNLLNHIKPKVRKNIVYRQYNPVKHFSDYQYIKNKFPEISVLTEDMWDNMLTCKLMVFDHPSTSLCQALAWNIPTVVFWNHDEWSHNTDGEKLFYALKEAGILFDSHSDAAKQINEIWDNVEDWWNSKNVQSARKKWTNSFAHSSRFWWIYWLKAAWQL